MAAPFCAFFFPVSKWQGAQSVPDVNKLPQKEKQVSFSPVI